MSTETKESKTFPYPEEFREMFFKAQNENEYPVKYSHVRNILFVGKARAGKTTVFKVLKDPTHLAGVTDLFAQTKDPAVHPVSIKIGDVNYALNFIDTPGLYETAEAGKANDFRDNDYLKKLIKKCLQSEIKKIHAIFFVFSFTTGVDKDQVEAFLDFSKMLKGAEDKFAIIITRAEDFRSERKKQLIEEMEQQTELKQFLDKIGGRSNIFFSGAFPKQSVERGFVRALETKSKNIIEMRNCIYKKIFDSKTPCHLKNIEELSVFERDLTTGVNKFDYALKQYEQLIKNNEHDKATIKRNELFSLRKDIEDNLQFFNPKKNGEQLNKFNILINTFNDSLSKNMMIFLECDIKQYLANKNLLDGEVKDQKLYFDTILLGNYINSVLETAEKEELKGIEKHEYYINFKNIMEEVLKEKNN